MQTDRAIVELVSRQPMSIAEIARSLSLTRNSVYVQLCKLVASGVLELGERRASGTRGKPAQVYSLAPGREDTYSTAYKPAFASLMAALNSRLSESQLTELMQVMGDELAARAGLDGDNLQASVDAVNALGASAQILEQGEQTWIECTTCPLASGTRCESGLCSAVARFFTQGSGRETTAHCERGERMRCRFLVE